VIDIFEHIFEHKRLWRRALGVTPPRPIFFRETNSAYVLVFLLKLIFSLMLILISSSDLLWGREAPASDQERPFLTNNPYVPQHKDYGFELGAMRERKGLYWMGINLGFNSGLCFASKDPQCQQYIDLIFGAGGREGETHYMGLISPRWQWVRFPSSWSPFARGFGGVLNSIETQGSEHMLTWGGGIGVARQLHERADMRIEFRFGYGDEPFGMGLFSIQLKIDRLIEYFAKQMQGLGEGAVSATGGLIKGTATFTGKVIETTGKGVGKVMEKTVTTTVDVIKKTGKAVKEAGKVITGDKSDSETKNETKPAPAPEKK